MTNVTTKPLPHGAMPFKQVRDPQLRTALMHINENILAIDKRLKAVESAAREIQRRA